MMLLQFLHYRRPLLATTTLLRFFFQNLYQNPAFKNKFAPHVHIEELKTVTQKCNGQHGLWELQYPSRATAPICVIHIEAFAQRSRNGRINYVTAISFAVTQCSVLDTVFLQTDMRHTTDKK
jgi:hypothetical protein